MMTILKQEISLIHDVRDVSEAGKIYLMGIGFDRVFYSRRFIGTPESKKLGLDKLQITGIPDLIAFKKKEFFFVEVKKVVKQTGYKDSLRESQLIWQEIHSDYNVIILYLEIKENKELDNSKIQDLTTELDSLKSSYEALLNYSNKIYSANSKIREDFLYFLKITRKNMHDIFYRGFESIKSNLASQLDSNLDEVEKKSLPLLSFISPSEVLARSIK